MSVNNKKSWDEFKRCGMLWWVNMMLHTFGWAICAEMNGEEIVSVYPARVKFRGFSESVNTDGYQKVSEYLKNTATALYEESCE